MHEYTKISYSIDSIVYTIYGYSYRVSDQSPDGSITEQVLLLTYIQAIFEYLYNIAS